MMKLKTFFTDMGSFIRIKISALFRALRRHIQPNRPERYFLRMFGIKPKKFQPRVAVFGLVESQEDINNIKASFDRQSYPNKQLFLFMRNEMQNPIGDQSGLLPLTNFKTELEGKSDFIACFSAAHYYGAGYLMGLVLSAQHANISIIGKSAHYSYSEGTLTYHEGLGTFRLIDTLQADRGMFAAHLISIVNPQAASQGEQRFTHLPCLSIDANNFCAYYSGKDSSEIEDLVSQRK